MFSLFSSFDFSLMFFPKFLELLVIISFLCFLKKFSMASKILKSLNFLMSSFLASLSIFGFSKMVGFLLWCVMLLILLMNFASVFPFNFAYTSQLSMVLLFSLGIWGGTFIFYLSLNVKGFMAHCIPEGSPKLLIPALFLIEVVSTMIRPITLTVRLVANILAGHLLLILLAKVVYFFAPSLIFYFLLNVVELFVALIQAYIFTTMLTLYYCDVS